MSQWNEIVSRWNLDWSNRWMPENGTQLLWTLLVLVLLVPGVLAAWVYVYRTIRYFLDGVISWLLFFIRTVAIVLLLAAFLSLLVFNVYLFTYYSHAEPMHTIVTYGQTVCDMVCTVRSLFRFF